MVGQREEENAEASSEAYRQFRTLVDVGSYRESYKLFASKRDLVGWMNFVEAAVYYTLIKQHVGEAQASELYSAIAAEIEVLERALKGGEILVNLLKQKDTK